MKDIYIYASLQSWLGEEPEATIKGTVLKHSDFVLQVKDEKGFVQYLNLSKLFAVVY